MTDIKKPNSKSLENLRLGSQSQKKNNQRLNLSLPAGIVADLKKSGCPSKFVELLVRAHQEKRLLDPTELL